MGVLIVKIIFTVAMLEMTHIRCKGSSFIYLAKLISSPDCLIFLFFPVAFRVEVLVLTVPMFTRVSVFRNCI
jgi:hypothetical protein